MFAPGHGSTMSWFSRFCSKGKLTREEVPEGTAENTGASITQVAKGASVAAPQPPAAAKAPAPTIPITTKAGKDPAPPPPRASFKDVETVNYIAKNGIYTCKHCQIFRTGSSASMNLHLTDYHAIADGLTPQPMVDPEADQVVRTSRSEGAGMQMPQIRVQTGTPATNEAQTAAGAPAAAPAGADAAPDAKEVFTCDVAGCEKQFASAAGLTRHKARAHAAAKG